MAQFMEMHYRHGLSLIQVVLITFLMPYPSVSYSADLTVDPGIEIQEVFTDNLFLRPGGNKEADFITTITPSLSLRNRTLKSDVALDYSLQSILYADAGENNTVNHIVRANTNTEVLRDRLFFDFSLNRSTQNTNRSGRTARDNLSVSEDRTQVLRYSFSPYWNQRLGSFADASLRYSVDELDSGALNDSSGENIDIRLSSGPDFNRIIWDLSFEDNKVENADRPSTRLRTLSGNVKYLLTRKFAFVSEIGYQDNDFESNSGDTSGRLWSLGIDWKPSTRTSLAFTYGKSFFGDDLSLQISHRSRRGRVSVTYEKEPSLTRNFLLAQQSFNLLDAFGDQVDNSVLPGVSDLDLNIPEQSPEVLIRSRLNGVIGYTLKKNTFTLSSSYEENSFQVSGESELRRRVDFSWNWNVLPKSVSVLNFGWSKNNLRNDRDERYYSLQYRLSYQLSAEMDVSLGYSYIDRQTNDNILAYSENRVTASLSKRF